MGNTPVTDGILDKGQFCIPAVSCRVLLVVLKSYFLLHLLLRYQGPILLIRLNFDPSMPSKEFGINYLSIPKLQRCNRWSLGMDKHFYPTLCNGCYYLSIVGLTLSHVSKNSHGSEHSQKYLRMQIFIAYILEHFTCIHSMKMYIAQIIYTPHICHHLILGLFILF